MDYRYFKNVIGQISDSIEPSITEQVIFVMVQIKLLCFCTLLLISSAIFGTKAESKAECQTRIQATAGQLIQEAQDEWDTQCVRYLSVFWR